MFLISLRLSPTQDLVIFIYLYVFTNLGCVSARDLPLRCSTKRLQCTMSAKSPWNMHAVVGIFYFRPFFAAEITIVSPLPPLYIVESIAEVLRYMARRQGQKRVVVIVGRCSSTAPLSGKHRQAVLRP